MTPEQAIEELREIKNGEIDEYGEENIESTIEAIDMAIEALQKRKTGKWIITARNGTLCSECKSGLRKMPMLFGNPLFKYCPFCGLKIEGAMTEVDE